MPLIEPIIRPPAEAESLLLQVTVGCSACSCSFCGAYLSKPFRLQPQEVVFQDIDHARRRFPHTRRVFLLDGDALAVGNDKLIPVLDRIEQSFPYLTRIASYANGFNITARTEKQLADLRARKLSLIYLGLESGSQRIIDACRKKSSVAEMVTAVRRLAGAGIKSSVIVLLGLGGKGCSAEHVSGTIQALNEMQPRYLSFLSLMLLPGTPLYEDARTGVFEEQDARGMLTEARDIIRGLELRQTVFRCDHASNYLPLEGRFPKDKDRLLTSLEEALLGRRRLRLEFFRGL